MKKTRVLGLTAALACAACGSAQSLAPGVVAAARPDSLPLVVSCWERAIEQSDESGSYLATVDFTIEAKTSHLRDAEVVSIESTDKKKKDASVPAELAPCIERALEASSLPIERTSQGPGFRDDRDVRVIGYRLGFVDASSERRSRASKRQANVLLGPRADRCQGLYSHDPPLDASALYAAVAQAEARAQSQDEPDGLARELQKAYDAELELRERLSADLRDPLLPEANQTRIREALVEVEKSAAKTGKQIGCVVPKLAP